MTYSSAPAALKTTFCLVPFDNANGPSACPTHLLHVSDDGSSPIELVSGAFELFKGAARKFVYCLLRFHLSYCIPHLRLISSALHSKELRPFVNVTAAPCQGIYAEKFKHHVMWQDQNRSVLFTMIGSVQGCHLVELTTLGQHVCKSITIVPYGKAWRKFHEFLGQLYGQGQMRGPFEYGCLLMLSGRREGYSLGGEHLPSFVCMYLHLLRFRHVFHRFIQHVDTCHPQEKQESLWWIWCFVFY